MNIITPLPKGAAHATELPGNSVTSFLKMVGDGPGLFADGSPDGWLGMLMSGLAGVLVLFAMWLYFALKVLLLI